MIVYCTVNLIKLQPQWLVSVVAPIWWRPYGGRMWFNFIFQSICSFIKIIKSTIIWIGITSLLINAQTQFKSDLIELRAGQVMIVQRHSDTLVIDLIVFLSIMKLPVENRNVIDNLQSYLLYIDQNENAFRHV